MSRIAKRYAQALLKLTAGDLGKAKNYRDSLNELKALFSLNEAAKVLCSPVMPNDLKKSLLSYGLKVANAADELSQMVNTVVDAGRVSFLPQVIDVFAKLIDEAEGKVHVEVTSAVSLPPEDTKQIATALSHLLGKKAEITQLVDSSLLGGFVVKVGDYVVDLSLKAKLEGLANAAVQDTIR